MQRSFLNLLFSSLIWIPSAFAQSGPGSLQLPTRQDLPAFQVRQATVTGLALWKMADDLAEEIQTRVASNQPCHFKTITCTEAYDMVHELAGHALQIGGDFPQPETDANRIKRQRGQSFNRLAYLQWALAREIPALGGMDRALGGSSPYAESLCQDMYTLYWMLQRSFVSNFPPFSGYTVYDDSTIVGTSIQTLSTNNPLPADIDGRFDRAQSLARVMKFYATELNTRLSQADATGNCLLPMPCAPVSSQKMQYLVLALDKFDHVNSSIGSTPEDSLNILKNSAYIDTATLEATLYRNVFQKAPAGRATSFASSREAAEGLFQSYFMLSCHFYDCPRAVGGSSGGGRDD